MAKPRMTPKLMEAIEATREVLREDIHEEGWRPATEDDYESWYDWVFEYLEEEIFEQPEGWLVSDVSFLRKLLC